MSGLTVDVYSEKAIVVRHTLEHHGPIMEQLGGTFNEKLKGGRGWIFSKFKLTQVRNVVDKLNSGQYGNEYEQKSAPSAPADSVSKTEFLSVLSRVERLEALVANLMAAAGTLPPVSTPTPMASPQTVTAKPVLSKPAVQSRMIEEEDMDDESDEPPVERKRLVSIRK
jgi:hypothetical protein